MREGGFKSECKIGVAVAVSSLLFGPALDRCFLSVSEIYSLFCFAERATGIGFVCDVGDSAAGAGMVNFDDALSYFASQRQARLIPQQRAKSQQEIGKWTILR